MSDPPPQDPRASFYAATSRILGHFYPADDRTIALAAISAACAKTPPNEGEDGNQTPLDHALRAFVVAILPLVGHQTADTIDLPVEALAHIKRRTLESMLSAGPSVLIMVNATAPAVVLPDHLLTVHGLTLRVGLALKPPIDLRLDVDGMRAVFSFNQRPFDTFLPWDAVFAMVVEGTQEGAQWPQSIPPELTRGEGGVPKESPAAESGKVERKLSLVPMPEVEAVEVEAAEEHNVVKPYTGPGARAGLYEVSYADAPRDPVQDAPPTHEKSGLYEILDERAIVRNVRKFAHDKTDVCSVWDPDEGLWVENDEHFRERVLTALEARNAKETP